MADLEHLTEQEQKEWTRGYPYSMAFTQGVVHRLSLAAAKVARLEAANAALAAALRVDAAAFKWLAEWADSNERPEMAKDMRAREARANAVLSDTQTGTAGKGWPEVRIQWRRGKGSRND